MNGMRGPNGFTESMLTVGKLYGFVPEEAPVASDSQLAQ